MAQAFQELAGHYFKTSAYTIESVPFGLTNATQILKVDDQKYVLRIYNRYTKQKAGIMLEHELCSYLTARQLSFSVPLFIKSLDGRLFVELADGSIGSVMTFLEGTPPHVTTTQQAFDFGSLVGEVVYALSQFSTSNDFKGVPFTDWLHLHELANYEAVQSFFKKNPFQLKAEDIRFLTDMMNDIDYQIDKLAVLPRQFVHHDLLVFNLLAVQQQINGVLDFDFAALDIGIIDFAICLNHVLQLGEGAWELAEAFVQGYGIHQAHTLQELEQLQLLTQIYHIAVLHIYIGQYYDGKPVEQPFGYVLQQLRSRDQWLQHNNERLIAMIKQKFKQS